MMMGTVFWWLLANTLLARAKQPHIVLMVLDDLGWNDLGYRSDHVNTPTLDRLAANGVLMLNYYGMSSCAPTRSTIMTGRHVTRTGIYTPFAGNQPEGVPLNETFLPRVLKKYGYATHIVGKWHLGFYEKGFTPTFRGFDTFYGFYGWGEDYFKHMSSYPTPSGKSGAGYDFRDEVSPNCGPGCSIVDYSASGTYSTSLFAARAVKIINAHNKSTPMFLYLPWQAVHAPRQVPPQYAAPYLGGPRQPEFCGMVAAVDEGISNVTEALRRTRMLDNTFIVVTADNGGPVDDSTTPGVHEGDAIGASNYPLRGGKHSLFEGGVRLNAFVWSKQLKHRKHYGLMHTVDWFATLARLAGVPPSSLEPLALDGLDQWEALRTGQSPHDVMFLGCQHSPSLNYPRCALRFGPWKLIVGDPNHPYGWSQQDPTSEAAPGQALYGYKMLSNNVSGSPYKPDSILLFNVTDDLTGDVGEHTDLSKLYPRIVKKMMKSFAPYKATMVSMDYAMDRSAPKGEPIDGVWEPWVTIAGSLPAAGTIII